MGAPEAGSAAIGEAIAPGGISGCFGGAHFASATWATKASSLEGGLGASARATAANRSARAIVLDM
jgi:hypothetical protein